MIIPLGHDQLTLRRWPIVTFALITLCWVAFLTSALFGRQPDPTIIQQQFGAALTYYVDHPHLEPDPRLRGALEHMIARADPASQREMRQRLSVPADPPSPLDQTRQQRLDRLTQAWITTSEVGPIWDYGLVPSHFTYDRLVTYLFIHTGVLHLLFNMLFLYLCGPSLEDVWGRSIFTGFYLAAGAASALFFVALYPTLTMPLVGASGAIAGLMGAFFVRFPKAQIRVFYLWIMRAGTTTIPAWFALLMWIGGEIVSALLTDHLAPATGSGGVAHWGHIGGFAFGVAFALFAQASGLEEYIDASASHSDRVWRATNRALARDDTDTAWRILRTQIHSDPSNTDAALAYWDLAHQLGRSREAAPVLLTLIRGDLTRNDSDAALARWAELKERVPDGAPSIDLAVKLAACMAAHGKKPAAAELLRDALRRTDVATAPQVLADLATAAATVDDDALGAEAAARALAHPALPRAVRSSLEQLAIVSN